MKPIESVACLLCAGVLMMAGTESHAPSGHAPITNAQAGQAQNQNDRVRQLQSQPPKINTEQEWQAAVQFMEANCPNRINFVMNELQNQNRPMQLARAKELILKQYRNITNTKDPQIHEIAVRQAQIQDQVFGAQIKFKQANARNDVRGAQDAKIELKKAVDQLVNVQIALRQVRILRLQSEIDNFQRRRQEFVNNWFNDELKKATANTTDGPPERITGDAVIGNEDSSPPNKK